MLIKELKEEKEKLINKLIDTEKCAA